MPILVGFYKQVVCVNFNLLRLVYTPPSPFKLLYSPIESILTSMSALAKMSATLASTHAG